MTQIHFIEKLKRQQLMDPHTHTFASGNWRVEPAAAEALVGARIYFHETAAGPSYFGGEITGFRAVEAPDPEAGRVVFIFKADQKGRGVLAGRTGWRLEHKTVHEPVSG
jgi:hypothetical protein